MNATVAPPQSASTALVPLANLHQDSGRWLGQTVRRFRKILYGIVTLFFVTEMLALIRVVRGLTAVSFGDLMTNPLFAIGFGSPFVLHMSGQPRRSEILATMLVGLLLMELIWSSYGQAGVTPIVTGLGLASIGALSLRAWRTVGRARTLALAFLLPACVALFFTFEAGILLNFNSALFSRTNDSLVYLADGAFGTQLSFVFGEIFERMPALAKFCYAIYIMPPPALMFVYALQITARKPPGLDVITPLLGLGLVGYCCYFLFPIAGPHYAFENAFPSSPPNFAEVPSHPMPVSPAPRNGMPSLHVASALLAYWHAHRLARWARLTTALLLIGTVFATLGLGEHYFVDLVVAVPFTLAVQAACLPARPAYCRERCTALIGATSLCAGWLLLLRFAPGILNASILVPWLLTIVTICAVVTWEKRLDRKSAANMDLFPIPVTSVPRRSISVKGF